jgi:hypothetical protein
MTALRATAFILVAAIISMSGCDRFQRRAQDPYKNMRTVRQQNITKTIPAKGVAAISVKENRGAVSVNFEPVDQVTVSAVKTLKALDAKKEGKHIADFTVHSELKDGVLKVFTRYPKGFENKYDARVAYEITAPGGTDMAIETQTGAVAVTSGAGDVTVKTVAAPVAVSDALGAVSVTTDSGDARVLHCFRGASVKTKTGNIEFRTEAPPSASTVLETQTGRVDILVPHHSDLAISVESPNADNAIAGFASRAQGGSLTLGQGAFSLHARSKKGAVFVIPFSE